MQLAPLDKGQVATLADHYGVTDVDSFLDAVRNSNAWSFLERPLDVQWLSAYWIANHRLGTLRDLVNFNIVERLKEKPDRPSVLALEKARLGASTLALVACLSRTYAFRFPDDAVDPRAQDAIDPREILTDWNNNELRDLLARGIFDEATYGRVRIHHRSVQEFLAAEELGRMLAHGFPRADLDALLFRQSSGRTVIPPHLTSVVAWLAVTDSDVRRKAINIVPEHLIDEGDPSALPPSDRRTTLKAYAARFADRKQVFHHFDPFGLQRFACTELAESIRQALSSDTEPEHLKRTLLQIVDEGRLAELADAAVALALAPGTTSYLRTAAIRAATEAGGPNHRSQLASLAGQPGSRDHGVVAALLDALFPADLPISSVVSLLAATAQPESMTITSLHGLLPELSKRCTAAQRHDFLDLLTAEMSDPPIGSASVRVKHERLWFGECLAELIAQVADDGPPFPASFVESLDLLQYVESHRETRSTGRINTIVRQHARLRREAFWHDVELSTLKNKKFPRNSWELRPRHPFEPTDVDITWLKEDCVARASVHERLLAFDCLYRVLPRAMPLDEQWNTLSEVAAESDKRNKCESLARKLEHLRSPPLAMLPDETHREMQRMDLQQRAYQLRQRRTRETNHQYLRTTVDTIRSGTHFYALFHLHEISVSEGQSRVDGASLSIDAITRVYDAEVAEAAREGFKSFWRQHDPIAPESHPPNSTPSACDMGLVGLQLEIEDGTDLMALPEPLLRKVVIYATWKLNNFPAWLSRCAERRPQLVRDIFAPSLRLDYGQLPSSDNAEFGRLLRKVSYASPEVRRACVPEVVDLLRQGDPPKLDTLLSVVNILESTDALSVSETASLAQQRMTAASSDLPRFAVWWCQWMHSQPKEAVSFLEHELAVSSNPSALATEVFSRLWKRHDDRAHPVPPPFRQDREALTRLIPLVHQQIWHEDDVHHKGGFSPNDRDNSESLRNSLLNWLAEIEGPETVEALDRLSADAQFVRERDWIRHLADARAAANAGASMSTAEAARLAHTLIHQPSTTEELFAVALNRLEDIKHDLAHGDFSNRQVYNPASTPILEEPVQNYCAHELEHRRRTQYDVVREPEVTRKKKPDIRLLNARCQGPVTLEIKIAERWTLTALEDALVSQLVGTYMQANNSRYGVLIVCSSGPAKTWEVQPDVPNLDFQGLIARLQTMAQRLKELDPTIADLRVVAIDFH